MSKALNTIVKVFIVCGMLLGAAFILAVLFFPEALGKLLFHNVNGSSWRGYVSGALAVLAMLGCEFIALTMFKMMRSLEQNPFVAGNVAAMRRMGFTALGVTACGLITLAFVPAPLLVVGALPVGLCGLCALVLSNVFSRAVAYKEENDLTV